MKSVVSIVSAKEIDVETAVRRAIDLAGGLSELITSGSRVLIKPNLHRPEPSGTGLITDCRVTEAVTKVVLELEPRSVIIGEGGSGGALALGVGNRVLMMENAIYSVISPEGCASILWRDDGEKEKSAVALKLDAASLKEFGVIDEIIPEPNGGAHSDFRSTAENLGKVLSKHLKQLSRLSPEELVKQRIEKYSHMGEFKE